MIKIKMRRLGWLCLIALLASYPLAVAAATQLEAHNLTAPFLVSWIGIWVFAAGGGFCASFIHVTDVDNKLKNPAIAKMVIGTFWGVALCLVIDALTSTPMGALPFFALFASCFSAPLCAGAMVYVGNQDRQNKAYDQILRRKAGIDLSSAAKDDNETY